jgi:hypothetical protein
MKHTITLAVALLLGSQAAVVSVRAQNATSAVPATVSHKLPTRAAGYLTRYRSRTEAARRAYNAAVAAEQARLERALRWEMVAATKRSDFSGAQAILTAIKEMHMGSVQKSVSPPDMSGAQAQIEETLLGKWSVHCGPTFQTVWTFRPDGTVLSVNGAPKGHWQWEQGKGRILIRWSETEWDSLNLPLNTKRSVGSTYHPEGWTVEAVKLL